MPLSTWLKSPISFDDYVFPAGFRLSNRAISPKHDEVRLQRTAGAFATPPTLGESVVKVQGHIGGEGSVDVNGDYILDLDGARAEANRMLAGIKGVGKLKVGASDGRYLVCQNRRCKIEPVESTNQTLLMCELEFVAGDPRWLSSTLRTLHIVGGTTPPNLNSLGSAPTYPKFTHTGALSTLGDFFTLAVNWGTFYQGIFWATNSITFASADVFVLDCDPAKRVNAITLNGVDRMDLLANSNFAPGGGGPTSDFPDGFPIIPPAGSSWAFTFQHFNVLDVEWRDAWCF